MASRRRARQFALQALYAWDQSDLGVEAVLQRLWYGLGGTGEDAEKPAASSEIEFATRLAQGVERRLEEVDTLIEAASVNWRLVRMPVVDRNILRLASYELLACHDIPPSVSINEAVELAKRYGDKDSRAFVNGILDRIASDTGRGGRRHRRGKSKTRNNRKG